MAALLALVAAIGWGGSDFAAGLASRKSSAVSVVILTHLVAAGVLIICLFQWHVPALTLASGEAGRLSIDLSVIRPGLRGSPGVPDVLWGAAAGISGGFGAMMLYRGLARGVMAVVAPITALGAAALPATWGIVTGDALTIISAGALVLAMAAITLVSASAPPEAEIEEEDDGWPKSPTFPPPVMSLASLSFEHRLAHLQRELLLLREHLSESIETPAHSFVARLLGRRTSLRGGVGEALLAGLGFGLFFVMLAGTSDDAGLFPLAVARGLSVVLFAAGAIATSAAVLPEKGSRWPVVLAGLLDGAAAISYLAASRTGLLSVAAVLSSLYPGVTVLLARGLANERLAHRQLMGLACAGSAVAMFALG